MAGKVLICVIFGTVLSLDHPNSVLVSQFAEQPCQALAGVGGEETRDGYPAQQSKSPYMQEHPTEVREGVLQTGKP